MQLQFIKGTYVRRYFLLLILLSLSKITSAQNADSKHPRVYKINLNNKFIDSDGTIILYKTLHKQVYKGTCYEFYNDRIFATTLINISSKKTGDARIYYRNQPGTNVFSQIIYGNDDLPNITSFELIKNNIKEIVANGNIFRLYRENEFIQLVAIKTLNGEIIFKIQ